MMIRILIIVLIVLAGAAALTQMYPSAENDSNPIVKGLATVQSWFRETSAPKLLSDINNETIVYKWQDSAGEWHFSNQPPPIGVTSSVEIYRSDVNITQAPAVKKAVEPTVQSNDIPTTAAPLLPITNPARVKQLIDDAKNVQNLVNNRQQTLDAQIDPQSNR